MSVDLTTAYLGLHLANPLVVASSPLTGSVDNLRQLAEAGAAAVVLPSLSETAAGGGAAERTLALVRDAKRELKIPVIGSLEGHSRGGWLRHAQAIEDAGADALELNLHHTEWDPKHSADVIETRFVDLVAAVKETISIPLSVKVVPYYSAPAHFAHRLAAAGAAGLVLFHRFPRPDIDLETLGLRRTAAPASSYAACLPMRWIALLRDTLPVDLAGSGGVNTPADVLKLVLVGADVVQLASALRARGAGLIRTLHEGISSWMEEHEYGSVHQLKGSMSRARCPDPRLYEREDYDPDALPHLEGS